MPGKYPPIADFGLIGDGQSAALVSRDGSIDWCCLPRFDSGSCFGRLLDWEKGGHFSVTPVGGSREASIHRDHMANTMVLEIRHRVEGGEAMVIDCMSMTRVGSSGTGPQLLRVIEGVRGSVDFDGRGGRSTPAMPRGSVLWGISPLSDQTIGGAIMFTEGATLTLIAFAWLFLRWTREAEHRQVLLEGGFDPVRAGRSARYAGRASTHRPAGSSR